ncbi:MAG: hypothetical protein NVS3B5_14950 [Sphingomicrobium sp.]
MAPGCIGQAQAEGRLRAGIAPDDLVFASRAFVYGVARMWVDGHFREWRVERPAGEAMAAALDLFIGLLVK